MKMEMLSDEAVEGYIKQALKPPRHFCHHKRAREQPTKRVSQSVKQAIIYDVVMDLTL
jgi:hypothetical protein